MPGGSGTRTGTGQEIMIESLLKYNNYNYEKQIFIGSSYSITGTRQIL